MIKLHLLYYITIFFNFMGLLIITDRLFNIDNNSINIHSNLTKITSYYFFKNLTLQNYELISYCVLCILIIKVLLFMCFYYYVKTSQSYLMSNSYLVINFISTVILVASNHIKEFLMYGLIKLIFTNNSVSYIAIGINIISFIWINISIYFN